MQNDFSLLLFLIVHAGLPLASSRVCIMHDSQGLLCLGKSDPECETVPHTSGRDWDHWEELGPLGGTGTQSSTAACWGWANAGGFLFCSQDNWFWGGNDRHLLLLCSGVLRSLGNTRKS